MLWPMRTLIFIATLVLSLQGLTAATDPEVTRATLKNGMRVWVKPTDFESEEVSIRLIAEGGFASLPEEQRYAGELAPAAVLESGFGDMDGDQLSALFYENSIEFSARVQPFSHLIEATLHSDSLEQALQICALYFTKQQMNEEGFKEVVKQTKEGLVYHLEEGRSVYEDAFRVLNTQDYSPIRPLKPKHLDTARFEVARDFLEASLADPSRFVCIVLGDFDAAKLMPLLEKTLGSIPKKDSKVPLAQVTLPNFPKEVIHKVVSFYGRPDSIGRITFPLNQALEESHAHAMDIGVQALELRLRQVMQDRFEGSHCCVNVTYELPLYPLQGSPWIVVQYRSEPRKTAQVKDVLVTAFKQYQENGPTPGEVEKVEAKIHRNQEYWLTDNDYWLGVMTNFAIWNWDPKGIVAAEETAPTAEKVKQVFQGYVGKDRHTWIYSQ